MEIAIFNRKIPFSRQIVTPSQDKIIKNDETSFIYIPSGMFSFTPTFDIISSVKA